jgi:hypothetical protein
MSGSLTVVGGLNSHQIAGIVTVPTALPAALIAPLQAYLSNTVAGAVTTGANFQNLNVAGVDGGQNISSSIASGTGSVGLLDITNTDTHGAITSGAPAGVSFTVNQYYNSLAVQAPGSETITGNGDTGFLAVFSSISAVTFNSGGGSGTVAAGGSSDLINVFGNNWVVTGDTLGGDTVAAVANSSQVSVYGSGADDSTVPGYGDVNSNIVGMGADSLSINADGSNDLITSYEGASGVVSIGNGGHMVVDGGAVTVIASAGSTFAQAAFGEDGGQLDFINNSSAAATVATSFPSGAIGGSTTAFGGAGGGIYAGGLGPSNSLVGGTGLVTLISAGNGDYLSASGSATGGQNVLQAGTGNATLIGTAASYSNVFFGGSGSDSILSSGKGSQTFFVGAQGSETLTGSTATGATNTYIFNQDTTGGGQDIITNFSLTGVSSTSSHLYINPNTVGGGVSIVGIAANPGHGGGVLVSLTDNTTIKLYGVSLQQADASTLAGGTTQLGNF